MRVVCIGATAATLSDHQRPRGSTDKSKYPLSVGSSYTVLGMLLWENVLSFLVPDDLDGPCYAPVGLFDLDTWELPDDWRFGTFSGIRASGQAIWTDSYQAAWGYDEFVTDYQHGIDLAEREQAALEIFTRRRLAAEHTE